MDCDVVAVYVVARVAPMTRGERVKSDKKPGSISYLQPVAWTAVLLLAALVRIPGISPAIAAWHPDEYNFVFWPLLILLG